MNDYDNEDMHEDMHEGFGAVGWVAAAFVIFMLSVFITLLIY